MTTAYKIDGIAVRGSAIVEGEFWFYTDCPDYDVYKALPDVVMYDGKHCTKQGWNSDTGNCHYTDRRGAFALTVRK